MSKKDALGFDRLELANVKRCAAANKGNYKKIDALRDKILHLGEQLKTVQALAETWDAPAKQMSQEKLGVALSAREIVYYHEHPEQLYQDYPELAANEPENAPVPPVEEEENPVF